MDWRTGSRCESDITFNWKFLFYMLLLFWPVSVWKYCSIARRMQAYGIKQWGGLIRGYYIGLAVFWIPIVTAILSIFILAVL